MAVNVSPFGPKPQFELSDGTPAVGNQLFFYAAGSVGTKQNTYTDSTGGSANANPIVLNSLGMPTTQIWFTTGQLYKVVYAPSTDTDPPTSPIWTIDNLAGINDVVGAFDEWKAGPAPTFVSATSFTLVGDQTGTFQVGRRLKTTNTSGTIYSTIITSAFGVLTTVTVVNDSGVLDSGLSAVSYGLLSAANKSIPTFNQVTATSSVSGTNTITANATTSATGYVTNQMYSIIPAAVNTGATTLNLNGLGAKNVFSNGFACVGGELRKSVPTMLSYDGTQFNIHTITAPINALSKAIFGLTYDTGTDTVNDWNINTGGAMDATGAYYMRVGTALGKQSDVAWAVGGTTAAPAGALDTGAVGNSDYYIWLIARSDTGVVDALFSLSSTAPTMPTNYDYKRLIGWFKRVGGTVVAAHTYETEGGGLEMMWDSPTLDINLANTLTTARRTDAIKVPLNFSVLAYINPHTVDAGAGTITYIYCPDMTDLAPSATATPVGSIASDAASGGMQMVPMWIRTSATGTIASRSNLATVDTYVIATLGFRWARRN